MADANASESEPSLSSPGLRLRQAREAAGLSREQVAKNTNISVSHLAAIEADRFAVLPGRTYAIGFSRSYARSVGLDENEIASEVRAALNLAAPAPAFSQSSGFRTPARVPNGLSIIVVALLALTIVTAAVLLRPRDHPTAIRLPLPAASDATPQGSPSPWTAASGTGPDQHAVVLTAEAETVWIRIKDASGKQIVQKELAPKESFTVPAGAQGPLLSTAHPEALTISVGGRPLAHLADRQKILRDVPVSPDALLARAATVGEAGPAGR